MNVSNVQGVGRVVLSNPSRDPAAEPGTSPSAVAALERATAERQPGTALVEYDERTNQPIPPRFPWLSRLTRELEPASKQPSPYGSLPILGERLDRTA